MSEKAAGTTLPPLPGLIAGGLVVLGVLLWMFVARGLLVVAGLGAFGPGLLRELGWLEDQDEFQRQSAHRAGYHAYLIGGLTAVLVVSAVEGGWANLEASSEWLRLVLVVLWLSWLFSALLAYWGAVPTTRRILLAFGSFWAVFVVASLIGEFDPGGDVGEAMVGISMALVFVVPFFVLAWSAGRWPRRTGLLLLVVSALLFVITIPRGGLDWSTVLLTDVLLLVPLIACGIALLRDGSESDEELGRQEA